MTHLVVDFPKLQAAIDHMAAFKRDVTATLETIDQTMVHLHSSWHGSGSDAQAQAQRQWEDGAEQMQTALSKLQDIAEAAQKNYKDAVDKNGQMWG
jgi:WXG100 family type VII secretion target